ncbi:MAG: hypothetical protein OXU19_00735 [bacterium]|nr:hypothetical protein [bacterium]
MRFRRHAVSVVVTDLAGTTAQDDIAHATSEASLHRARRLDVAVGANLARAALAGRARHASSASPWSAAERAS